MRSFLLTALISCGLIGCGVVAQAPVPAMAQSGCGAGNPNCVAPTPPAGDNSNRIANTKWVQQNGGGGGGSAGITSLITFGAACDGVTDDSAVINNALTSISAAGGGTLLIPPGKVCVANGQIVMQSGVSLYGGGLSRSAGTGNGTLKLTSNINTYWISANGVSNFQISYLRLDAGGFDGGASSGEILASSAQNFSINHISALNQGRFGIVLASASNFDVTYNLMGCFIATGACGTANQNEAIIAIGSNASSGGIIAFNNISGTGTDLSFLNTSIVDRNFVTSWAFGAAVGAQSQTVNCRDLVITNNFMISGVNAIDANGNYPTGIVNFCPESTIIGNTVTNSGGEGIDAGGYNSTVANNTIYDNGTAHTGLNGITAKFATTTSFTGQISGTTLTVSGSCTGPNLGPGAMIFGAGVTPGTIITSGSGCAGTYTVNFSQSIGSEAMTWSAGAQGSTFTGNVVFNTKGAGGTQQYSYQEQSSSLFGIALANNNFGPGTAGTTNILSPTTATVANAPLELPIYTIANLPSCSSALKGFMAFVADTVASGAASFHGTVTGGGATTVNSPVSCSGSNWQYD